MGVELPVFISRIKALDVGTLHYFSAEYDSVFKQFFVEEDMCTNEYVAGIARKLFGLNLRHEAVVDLE